MNDKPRLIAVAKVAKIVDPTTLAINAGSTMGVQKGDIAHIYRSEEIRDPDSDELLETLIFVRLRLRITSVFDRVSIADVTDRVDRTSTRNLLNSRPARQMTHEPTTDGAWIQIVRGESVRVLRPSPPPEEPPF